VQWPLWRSGKPSAVRAENAGLSGGFRFSEREQNSRSSMPSYFAMVSTSFIVRSKISGAHYPDVTNIKDRIYKPRSNVEGSVPPRGAINHVEASDCAFRQNRAAGWFSAWHLPADFDSDFKNKRRMKENK